jgi:hypothetical protein
MALEVFFIPFLSVCYEIIIDDSFKSGSNFPNEGLDGMFGLGLTVPLLLSEKPSDNGGESYFTLTPEAHAEYSPFSNLLRVRTGLCVGQSILFFGYSIGGAGILLRDFARDITILGIAPEIEFDALFIYRVQLRFEFCSVPRYNRIVSTLMVGWVLR